MRYFSGSKTEGIRTADFHYTHPFVLGSQRGQVRALFRDIMGDYYDFEEETTREYQAFLTLEVAL
jgi:hypothetical protein